VRADLPHTAICCGLFLSLSDATLSIRLNHRFILPAGRSAGWLRIRVMPLSRLGQSSDPPMMEGAEHGFCPYPMFRPLALPQVFSNRAIPLRGNLIGWFHELQVCSICFPTALRSTGITPLPHYYGGSDFSAAQGLPMGWASHSARGRCFAAHESRAFSRLPPAGAQRSRPKARLSSNQNGNFPPFPPPPRPFIISPMPPAPPIAFIMFFILPGLFIIFRISPNCLSN